MGMPDIYWIGDSRRGYGYWIHPIGARFRKVVGNVIFAKKTPQEEWVALYVGQIRDFDEGLADRETEACAIENGAIHAHVHHASPSHQVRQAEVDDLIAKWKPVCNR